MARTPKKTTAADKPKKKTDAAAVTGAGKKAAAGRKKPAKGYQKPEHIPNGEILTDTTKQQWKIGPSIGSGGFGEIYSACKYDGSAKKSVDYPFVLKIVSQHSKIAKGCSNSTIFSFNFRNPIAMVRYSLKCISICEMPN